ncbi:MAG TPA: translation initiation factor IF-2 [Sphingomonadaceae bacterium]|nr:translation initiation factor IF-2 [Sphingomonadaceae bacterium]
MSETSDKPKLGTRSPLGVKRTVETGQVKQSFSHGRSNTVVVEVKKRRILGPAGAAPAAEAPAPVVEAAPPPPPPAAAPVARTAAPPTRSPSAGNDMLSRREAQEKLFREAEEARMAAMEEARRSDARLAAQAAEEANKRTQEEARAPEPTPAAETPATPAVEEPAAAPATAEAPAAPAAEEESKAATRKMGVFTPVKRPELARVVRNRDDRRHAGKLTVTKALSDEDDSRARSLAALKRAREKQKLSAKGTRSAKQVRDVDVPETITVQELAKRMGERSGDLVKALFKLGTPMATTDTMDQDTAELIVEEFGHRMNRVSDSDVEIDVEADVDSLESQQPRPPVVTIMGHVDHGKTSLLDAIRGANVVSGEAGGITQHIGAYQVSVPSGDKITFLDTPGHEAFSQMRMRGADVTDIVVLVVAADDGLRPQTIEAIQHTKAAGVPMIVAINKIDKPGANPQKVREDLLQHEVIVEAMSGDVQDVEVSALNKTNLDGLLEAINNQAELLELTANPDRTAEATVIEARLDKGRGPLATVLVERGTLKVGDIFVVGSQSGKVRAMLDDKGKQVKTAGPSTPVEVLGLSGVPSAGDPFSVVENEARAREVAAYRAQLATGKRTVSTMTSVENMFSAMKDKQAIEFPIVVKADVGGSVEAIVGAINRISTADIKARVLHSGVGGITESDVTLAQASGAPIIGFNVRPNAKAREIAERGRVEMRYYDVIYHLTDWVKGAMAGQLGPEMIETVVGRAEVREVFSAGKHGKAAGLLVTEGVMRKALRARITRADVIIYNGAIASLRRFKDDVAEVRAGLECGVTFENMTDLKAGDFLETYEVEERERTL